MQTTPTVAATIDDYIASFPAPVQSKLEKLRAAIKKAAPQAQEAISYRMPAFKLHGNLVYFAGYARHIGFYPLPSAIAAFQADLSGYVTAKGSIQFPLDRPLPLSLIAKLVKFRVSENLARAQAPAKKRKK